MVTKQDVVSDIKRVYDEQGKVTRFIYRIHGKHSERQIKNLFGNFRSAVLESEGSPIQTFGKVLKETVEVTSDKLTYTLPQTRIDTLEKLIEHFKVDTSIWVVERFKANAWEMGYKDSNGKAATQPLYQVTATFVKQQNIVDAKEELESLKTAAKQIASIPKPVIRSDAKTGLMLEINIPDLHLGKLSWNKETGYGNYDTKIAINTFREALDTLLKRTAHFKFESIVLVTGNDLLHSDDLQGRTTSGTYVDNDGRYHKTFISARNMLIDAVERLRLLAPVKIVSCPGNHDKLSAWHVADSLECYFHNYDDIVVDNSPLERKYLQFGEVMLMFTHGNTGKKREYSQLMASEEKEMWGNTKYREAHTGHIHQTQTQESYGVRVRTLPALCEPDAWHAANAFVGNLRTAEAYVWSKDEGLVTQVYYNAD